MIASRIFTLEEDINEVPRKAKANPKYWGLIIGVENYAQLPSVIYAKKDSVLIRKYFGNVMGIPEENMILINDGEATKARITGYLKDYLPLNVDKDTVLYVFFAGHGAYDTEKKEPYLIPFVVLVFQTFSQDAKWLVVEGMASMENTTQEEARKLAIEDAMRRAVEEAVGADIISETLVINLKVAADIIKTLPYGKVLDREIIEEGVRETGKKGRPIPASEYRIKMKSKVFIEEGKADPNFKIAASFNRSFFKEGDEMEIRISSTRDCYLNIFNVLEDERVLILIPNHYRRENFVKANEAFTFPNDEDRRRGMKLKIHGLEGRKSIREAIYILGLQRPLR